ncbi:MAG TPA: glycosyltransferase family 4 protein [Acidimicrobiales bacterium]
MRVLHVAPTAFGVDGLFGGGERYPLELARALAGEPGVECELVTFGRSPGVRSEASGLRIRVLRPIGHWRGHPAHPISAALIPAVRSASVVHTHHFRSMPSRMAAMAAATQRRDRATVTTDHGLGGDGTRGLLPRLVDGFLVVSRYSAATLRSPPSKTRVVYGGADPSQFRPGPLEQRAGVLFVGRVTPHKGVDRLLRALPRDAELTIAGTAGHDRRRPERDYPRHLRRLAAGRCVRFLGPVVEEELPALHRTAAVFVLPSVDRTCYGRPVGISELLGLSVLEAMASATPVVASRVGGVPEVVDDGETGFLVEPGDVDALHDRIATVLADRGLARRLGDNARSAVTARFTWQACARRCVAAYRELVS